MHDILFQKMYTFALSKLSARDIPEQKLYDILYKKYCNTKTIPNTPSEQKAIITEVIEHLKSQKYINDERYCENFIRWRKESMPRGKYMIIQELIIRKIPCSLAKEMCNTYISDTDEYHMCEQLFQQKIKKLTQRYTTIHNTDTTDEIKHRIKSKLFQFLASKQFSYALINDIWEKNMIHFS